VSRLPERIDGEGLLLRRWHVDDAEHLHEAVSESAEHLRPWMTWIADEPQSLERRRAMLARWEAEWAAGGDALYAVLVGGVIVGSCGLHRRLGHDGLELGYWIHPTFTRRGLATKVAALLSDTVFSVPGIELVEIHHDKGNVASSGVPRRLGYEFVGEQADEATAPADTGVECVWRMGRSQWESR
jgi:ribosomal-protein-serine acetyltransferase